MSLIQCFHKIIELFFQFRVIGICFSNKKNLFCNFANSVLYFSLRNRYWKITNMFWIYVIVTASLVCQQLVCHRRIKDAKQIIQVDLLRQRFHSFTVMFTEFLYTRRYAFIANIFQIFPKNSTVDRVIMQKVFFASIVTLIVPKQFMISFGRSYNSRKVGRRSFSGQRSVFHSR